MAINSDDLRVRAAGIEVDIAARNLEKSAETVDRLEPIARTAEQGPRANALWDLGLIGGRGVAPERVAEILLDSVHDPNVNIRYWAVEGLAYLGTDDTVEPLLGIFHDDPSPMIRERAACSLAQSGCSIANSATMRCRSSSTTPETLHSTIRRAAGCSRHSAILPASLWRTTPPHGATGTTGSARLCLSRGASPLGLPDTLSRAPLRRRAPFAWLTRCRSSAASRPGLDLSIAPPFCARLANRYTYLPCFRFEQIRSALMATNSSFAA